MSFQQTQSHWTKLQSASPSPPRGAATSEPDHHHREEEAYDAFFAADGAKSMNRMRQHHRQRVGVKQAVARSREREANERPLRRHAKPEPKGAGGRRKPNDAQSTASP